MQLNGSGLAVLPSLSLIPGVPPGIQSIEELVPMDVGATSPSQVNSMAEQAINAAMGLPSGPMTPSVAVPITTENTEAMPTTSPPQVVDDPKRVGNDTAPSKSILIHNMFNKDEETDPGWEEDIKLDFEDEGGKHGTLTFVKVMSQEVGGKIYASFESIESAKACAENLAGRWFDKRQLRVEFVADEVMQNMR